MKKSIRILLVCTGTLAASCAAKKELPHPPPSKDTTVKAIVRRKTPGIEAILIVHPVENFAIGQKKTYHFFHDFPNGYIDFTTNDSLATIIRNYIPDRIGKDSVMRSVAFDAITSHAFVNFTDSVKRKIAKEQGKRFDLINDYQEGSISDLQEEKNSPEAMQLLLDVLEEKTIQPRTATPGKIPVNSTQGILRRHPAKSPLKDLQGKDIYYFYDRKNGDVYMTYDINIYEKFSDALTLMNTEKTIIIVQGIAIDPYVFLSKNSMDEMAKDMGIEFNGGNDLSKSINGEGASWLSGYLIVENAPEVIGTLKTRLGIAGTGRQNQLPQNDKKPNVERKKEQKPLKKFQQEKNDPNRPFDPNE